MLQINSDVVAEKTAKTFLVLRFDIVIDQLRSRSNCEIVLKKLSP